MIVATKRDDKSFRNMGFVALSSHSDPLSRRESTTRNNRYLSNLSLNQKLEECFSLLTIFTDRAACVTVKTRHPCELKCVGREGLGSGSVSFSFAYLCPSSYSLRAVL